MLDVNLTIEKYGYNPETTPARQQTKIVIRCDSCGNVYEMSRRSYDNKASKKSPFCKKCPEYGQKRSEIARKSNVLRTKKSDKYLKYLPYLEDLKTGKISLLEISRILQVDDGAVSKFYQKHFGIKSRFGNKSLQEESVYKTLLVLFQDVKRSVRYSLNSRHIADFFVEGVGFIEYDGSGFYHQVKESDKKIDNEFKPIRLNAQAYFGKEPYLRNLLRGEKTGYCSVDSVKGYKVKRLDKVSLANEMLENCHSLGSTAGKIVFGLFYDDQLIGVAKFGNVTNPYDKADLELRRFFVLDGTPRNTESFFLRGCEKLIGKGVLITTYIHSHEKGSYLKALGWEMDKISEKCYDSYMIGGRMYSKRVLWGWAKKIGLVDKFGTTEAKEILSSLLGGEKVLQPSKIKFTKKT